MTYVEAPEEHPGGPSSLFLAGGISSCPDWQRSVARSLEVRRPDLVVLNPRRASFPPDVARAQIEWEHRHLRRASALAFWFPEETLCPITLYELGAWSMTAKPLFVGVHPRYARKLDVEVQTGLARPDVRIVTSLDALVDDVATRFRPA